MPGSSYVAAPSLPLSSVAFAGASAVGSWVRATAMGYVPQAQHPSPEGCSDVRCGDSRNEGSVLSAAVLSSWALLPPRPSTFFPRQHWLRFLCLHSNPALLSALTHPSQAASSGCTRAFAQLLTKTLLISPSLSLREAGQELLAGAVGNCKVLAQWQSSLGER